MPTAWYANKIGMMFKVDESVKFENDYTIRISNDTSKANYGFVFKKDAEIVTPSILDKIKMAFGWK